MVRHVTDRQTDRQTFCHGIVRAMHMRRAVKMVIKQQIGLINVKNFHRVVRAQNDTSETTNITDTIFNRKR